jgi:hypothetical protein
MTKWNNRSSGGEKNLGINAGGTDAAVTKSSPVINCHPDSVAEDNLKSWLINLSEIGNALISKVRTNR